MSAPPARLEFEPTPIAGWLPADPGRLAAARAIRLNPELRPAFLAQGAAQANLERLFGGALCVTTGQQPGLFTGPLFTLHKALTAVALAREATVRLGQAVVPVFWVAGDDHDFAEGNHAYVLTASNDVEHLVLRERDASAPLTPLYREPVGEDVARLLGVLRAKLPETEFRSDVLGWLERHYRPDTDLASAFAHAVSDLLGPFGVVVFQPTHPAAKRAMAPWLVRLLEAAAPLNQTLVATAEELQRGGRPAPVTVGDGATLVMLEGPLGRDRLLLDAGAYVARRAGERWTQDGLTKLATDDAQRLSPNVLARPAVEAAMLPTLAYVAGPGELAYLPQAAPVYRTLGVAAQAVAPRWSGRVVEARVRKVLEKFAIAADALSQPEGRLEATLLADALPPAARDAIAALRTALATEYQRLADAAIAVDPTLRKPVDSARNAAQGAVAEIEKRLVAHLKKQNEILLQQLDKARRNLFPLGRPQERVLNLTTYAGRYGPAFLDALLAACTPHAPTLESLSDSA
ncbi:MAG: bacillithiol biosynthesis cysteine-adding enzyme BshC [Gemmatimonadetes bacterium]|nr:bacillithiol biosynthesis cysteine-adding enzyme BshC [Gemmatimonadota bacterium]